MYKYNIYIGMFDKDTKKQELSTQDFLNTVRKIMRYNFIDNYTIIKAKSHYKSDTMTVCEPTIIVEVITPDCLGVEYIKGMICATLNQESVLIIKQNVQVL